MSKFLIDRLKTLFPYTPGEQPKERKYVKLNTNESPFKPSKTARRLGKKAVENTQLYSDPDCTKLVEEFCKQYGVKKGQVLFTNGSDEILNFAFMGFCQNGAKFANITYGFYSVFACLNGVNYAEIPLREDLTINVEDYLKGDETVFIANPNAPTGIYLKREEIERILSANKNRLVVVDEAYIDFGGESCISLIDKYDNLLVTQTFSKSRSMAGARLGVGIANEKLIKDLNAIKYSTNPYNVNAITQAMGIGALQDREYFEKNCKTIIENRAYLTQELEKLGFSLTNSLTNFVFCKSDDISGKELNIKLKERGVLVRRFDKPTVIDYNRITVGSKKECQALIDAVKSILEEIK